MALDFNDAAPQHDGELIPDGVFCALHAFLRPGGENMEGCSEHDLGIFKLSTRSGSDAVFLEFEFTILNGPHAKRKLWQSFTVKGGKVGEDGVSKAWNISKATMRAMIDSAMGLDPNDMSEQTQAKRRLRGFRDLDGIEFIAKIGIKRGDPAPDGGNYPDRNVIARVVLPNEPQYAAVKAGQDVPPQPSSRPAATSAAASAQPKPVWQQQAAAAAPAPAAAPTWQQQTAAASSPASSAATPAATPAATSTATPPAASGPAWLRGESK
jgi:hypothetical protein